MKRGALLLMVFMLLISSVALAEKGPMPDKIYFDVRMQQDIGIQDTAQGKTDVFFYGLDGSLVAGLDKATLAKLELYAIPSGTWSLEFNPYPNKAPYQVKVNGKEYFNPFAIKEIRYAMNWLINRQYIVDEILKGAGGTMMTMATPGQPGTYKYNLVSSKLGMTPQGDQAKALADIEAAMKKAAALAENKGKLEKKGNWWTFNDQPISIKFLIRVDDPDGRAKEGEYVAQQIEKAGIKVERVMWDRVKCINTTRNTNPADYEWSIYTEGWGAGATRAFWEHIVAQMYAPWYGNMPGGANPDVWNYEQGRIDELTKKAYQGNFLTEKEYWDAILEAQELGLKDSVRVYVCYQTQFYVANKARFNSRMAYGLGDGLNRWSLVTADTKDGVLKATQYSARGGLFMGAWDPVGADGFDDVYANYIADPLYDSSMTESPVSALNIPVRCIPTSTDTKVHRDAKGEVVGDIKADPKAVTWDSKNKKWKEIGAGKVAMTKSTYKFRFGKYHHGVQESLVDYMYSNAFSEDWLREDTPGDAFYDAEYASRMEPSSETGVGVIYDLKNQTATNFYNYNFPPSKDRVASNGALGFSVTASGHSIGVTWEVIDALARMVAKGSKSGTAYSFSASKEGTVEVDVLRASCVADIKAELQKMVAENYVPVYIKDFLKPADAVKRYQAAIKFIDSYGHAYISNGPFYLAKYDAKANYAELRANRDASYPFDTTYWQKLFKTTCLTIDKIEVPVLNVIGKDINVKVSVSETIYPDDSSKPATKGDVTVMLLTDKGEHKFTAKRVGNGIYQATIPAAQTKALKAGTYTVLAIASATGAVPSTVSQMIVVR